MGATEQTIALLTRIALAAERCAKALEILAPEIASDRDLDSQYGDPQVKKDPRDWTGEQIAPRPMSECPAEYLDILADFYSWQAAKAEEKNEVTSAGKPVAPYRRQDAARARGWAKRIRAGWKPTRQASDAVPGDNVSQWTDDSSVPNDSDNTNAGGW